MKTQVPLHLTDCRLNSLSTTPVAGPAGLQLPAAEQCANAAAAAAAQRIVTSDVTQARVAGFFPLIPVHQDVPTRQSLGIPLHVLHDSMDQSLVASLD